MTTLEKEVTGKNLLDAMRSIGSAIHKMTDKEKYSEEIHNLYLCKSSLKTILNRHFDQLAIQRHENKS